MNQLLQPSQVVKALSSGMSCTVDKFLGGGGQGEVYRSVLGGRQFALKWYFDAYVRSAPRQRERLEKAIHSGPPSPRFLWPLELAAAANVPGFGYIMELREDRFKGIVDMMTRKVNPSFRALATAGFELADSYLLLHSRGLCYRDISFGNVFLDPVNGEVRICDNDNVDVDGQPGEVGGTLRFMAPEIVCGEAAPSIKTDRFSLAVLLFYLFMIHHPLEGKQESKIHSMDMPAMRKIYGTHATFIFDPNNEMNRPDPECHKNALVYWPIYPTFLRELFIRSFGPGIRDPENGRVMESEWRAALVRLRDSIMICPGCRAENFYDGDAVKTSAGKLPVCWNCSHEVRLPFRIRLGRDVVVLNAGTQLFQHHINPAQLYNFQSPVAEVASHPTQPGVLGLKNLTEQTWVYQDPNRETKEVVPQRSCRLVGGATINFGSASGEIRV